MPLNRILTDTDREELKPLIDEMFELVPDMMSRKISQANVQQAFVVDTVLKLITNKKKSILSVGSFEDTAFEYLKAKEYNTIGIDPAIDMDLSEYYSTYPNKKFDVIFATSVLEHVQNDDVFMSQICDMLKPNGIGIITCDFNNAYVTGAPVPATVVRQYTEHDFKGRFSSILAMYNCELLGEHDWSAKPDFIYQGHLYSFASFVFKKIA